MLAYQGVREVPLEELTPLDRNPRRGDVPAIRKSLRKNGQYRALVCRQVDGDLTILAGNHTFLALKEEGMPSARCEIFECDDETATRIALVDNKTAQLGGFDMDSLADLLGSLSDDLEGTGYTDADLAKMLGKNDEKDAPIMETVDTWGVVIECDSEEQQVGLLNTFNADGYRVRALMGS